MAARKNERKSIRGKADWEDWFETQERLLISQLDSLLGIVKGSAERYQAEVFSVREWCEFERMKVRNQQVVAAVNPGEPALFTSTPPGFWAYKGSRPSPIHPGFTRELISQYNSEGPNGALWCPIARRYHDPLERPAAYIFPFFLGRDVVKTVFGKDGVEASKSSRNGLIMSSSLEKRFDMHLITIVPAGAELTADGSIKRWKVVVINKDAERWRFDELGCTVGELNGIELEFKSDHRPDARFLYFRYVTALLLARKLNQAPGWLTQVASNEFTWVVPGPYIRENMLFALAQLFGCGIWEEASVAFAGGVVLESAPPSREDWKAAEALYLLPSIEQSR
jgi:hypothetical protein